MFDLAAGLLTLLAIIVVMDLIVWQPLSTWSEKFRSEFAASWDAARSLGMFDAFAGVGPAITRALRAILVPPIRLIVRALRAGPQQELLSAEQSKRVAAIVRVVVITSI